MCGCVCVECSVATHLTKANENESGWSDCMGMHYKGAHRTGLKLLHVKIVTVVHFAYLRRNHGFGHGNFHFLHFSAEAGCLKDSPASGLDLLAQMSADFPFLSIYFSDLHRHLW